MPNNIAAVICLTTGTSCLGHHDTRAELTWSAKASAASMPNSRCLCRAWRWTRSCSMRSASGEPRALKAPCGRASMQEGCFIFALRCLLPPACRSHSPANSDHLPPPFPYFLDWIPAPSHKITHKITPCHFILHQATLNHLSATSRQLK